MQAGSKFEVAIYNTRVRTAVRQAERNRTGMSDDWAETRYIEVAAETADSARAKIYARYPEHRGFVIEDVRSLD